MPKTKFQSLRAKITRTFLLIMGSTGIATLAIIVITSAQSSSAHLASVQKYIEQGITSKGKVLTENHARALRGLTLDNAFLEMQSLVDRVVHEDSDLVYGLYVNSHLETMASSQRSMPSNGDKPPAKDAWRKFQIPDGELLVSGESIKRANRLGEDLLEVAVPVLDDDGVALGTIRYGLSTRPMHDAIDQARLDSRAQLQRSVLWLAGMVIVATVLGFLLSGLQATRITRPIAELTVAAEARAKGNRAVSVSASSGDEIGLLGESFNRMGADLDASYRELEQLNGDLEKKVELRTVELAKKNDDMKLVLDNVGQGFLTLDLDGQMSVERSRVISEWFGDAEGQTSLASYIGRVDKAFGDWFELGWATLREDYMPLALCLEQLPAVIRQKDRTFEVAYRPILGEGEKLDKVLVVITDVTARIERERSEQAQREMMSIFKHTMTDSAALSGFFAETGSLVDAVASGAGTDLTLLRRQVHTIKGNAATFGLEGVAVFCNRLEDRMDEQGQPPSLEDRNALAALWAKAVHMRDQLAAEAPEGGVELDRNEYQAFLADLNRGAATQELIATATSWRFEAAGKRMASMRDQVRALAKRLGRAPVEVVIEPTRIRLPPAKWRTFWSAFTHVLRNTVDHGVGTVEERTAAGKRPEAKVVLGVARHGTSIVVSVSDDGPGVNWARIAARAKEHGLPHATPADLSNALFADGVTTREEVTTTSGRGVGLSAMREVVESLGGTAEVQSQPGRGTTFRFRLPSSMELE